MKPFQVLVYISYVNIVSKACLFAAGVGAKLGLWTLTMDWIMHSILDLILDLILDWTTECTN